MASKGEMPCHLISDASGFFFIRSTLPDSVTPFCKLKGAATANFAKFSFQVQGGSYRDFLYQGFLGCHF